MAIYSRSSIQNINNRSFWVRKNKCVIEFNQPDIDKKCSCAKVKYEAKYQYLINKRKSWGLKHFNDPKGFVEYSNEMEDVYKNIEKYNFEKKPIKY